MKKTRHALSLEMNALREGDYCDEDNERFSQNHTNTETKLTNCQFYPSRVESRDVMCGMALTDLAFKTIFAVSFIYLPTTRLPTYSTSHIVKANKLFVYSSTAMIFSVFVRTDVYV